MREEGERGRRVKETVKGKEEGVRSKHPLADLFGYKYAVQLFKAYVTCQRKFSDKYKRAVWVV